MGIENDISDLAVDLKVTGNLYIDSKPIEGVQTTTWGTYYLIEADVLKDLLTAQSRCSVLKKSTSYIMDLVKSNKVSQHSGDSEELKKLRSEVASLRDALKTAEERAESALKEAERAKQHDIELLDARATIESLQEEVRRLEESKPSMFWEASEKVREERKLKTFANTLSLSMQGMSAGEISEELKKRGYGGSSSHISRALSVLKDGDRERIRGIISAYPKEFEGITEDDFESWFAERYQKLKRIADKKAEKKADDKNTSEPLEETMDIKDISSDVDEWGEPIVPASVETDDTLRVRGISAPEPVTTSYVLSKPIRKARPKAILVKEDKTSEKASEEAPVAASEPVKVDIGLGEMPKNVEFGEKESFEERFMRVRREQHM